MLLLGLGLLYFSSPFLAFGFVSKTPLLSRSRNFSPLSVIPVESLESITPLPTFSARPPPVSISATFVSITAVFAFLRYKVGKVRDLKKDVNSLSEDVEYMEKAMELQRLDGRGEDSVGGNVRICGDALEKLRGDLSGKEGDLERERLVLPFVPWIKIGAVQPGREVTETVLDKEMSDGAEERVATPMIMEVFVAVVVLSQLAILVLMLVPRLSGSPF